MSSERQPFVGPRPFEKTDKDVFFGRDHETTELLSLIVAHPIVLLYAQSGAGKTSMLNAGLIPALEQEGLEVFQPARVSGADYYETDTDSIQNFYMFNAMTRWIDDSQEPEELHRLSLAEFLANRDHLTDEDGLPLLRVIIFDQFEEIFTSHPEFGEHRKAFFDQIRIALEGERGKRPRSGQSEGSRRLSKGDPLLRVLIVIREDYLAQMDAYAPQLPEKLRTRFRIERLREEAALAAVTGPLQSTNSRRVFAPGVAERLVKDLTKVRVETVSGLIEVVMGEFVEPVQLQVVCRRLLEAIPDDVTEITEEDLQDFGDVGHALMVFYEDCLKKAVSESEVTEASLRIWFDRTLITPAGTRGTVFIGQSESGVLPLSAVKVLEDLHLIRGEWRAGAKWYELTHDRLIEPIQESNRKWMAGRLEWEPTRQRLEAKAAEWVRLGRSHGGLLDEVELLEVERALASPNAAEMGFSSDLKALVKKSRDTIEESRLEKEASSKRELRLARRASITLFALIIIGIATATYIFITVKDQSNQERLSQLLAAQSISLLGEQPDLALLLSLEAYKTNPTFESRSSMLTGLAYSAHVTRYLHGHDNPVNGVAFSPDGKILASCGGIPKFKQRLDERPPDSGDYSIILWDTATNTRLGNPLAGHGKGVNSLAFSADGKWLASGSDDTTVKLWDMAGEGASVRTLTGHSKPVNAVAFIPGGMRLASGGEDGSVLLWDVATGEKRGSLLAGQGALVSMAVSPDGKLLAAGYEGSDEYKYPIVIWDLGTGKQLGERLLGHEDRVTGLAFTPDGKFLASGSMDTQIVYWNLATRESKSPANLQSAIHSLAFSKDGKHLVVGTENGIVLLDGATGKATPLPGSRGSVNSVAFSTDGETLASGSDNHNLIVCSITDRQKLARPLSRFPRAAAVTVAFASDSELAAGSWSTGVGLWNFAAAPSKDTSKLLTDSKTSVYSIAVSPDRTKLAWGVNDGKIFLWDVKGSHQIGEPLVGHSARVTSLAFSPDGRTLASASRDKSIILWDVDAHGPRGGPLLGHGDVVTSVAFNADGKIVASGSWDRSVIVWDVDTGKQRGSPLKEHTDRINAVAFSTDGRTLASGSQDRSIILWDVNTGEFNRFTGHNTSITSLAFSPDGKMLASGGVDRSIVLWNVNTAGADVVIQKMGQPMTGHYEAINSLAFSPDSKTLASGSGEDNAVLLWDVNPDSWAEIIAGIVNRKLNPEECYQYLGDDQECKSYTVQK